MLSFFKSLLLVTFVFPMILNAQDFSENGSVVASPDTLDKNQIQLSLPEEVLKAVNDEYNYISFITETEEDDFSDSTSISACDSEDIEECLENKTLENPYGEAYPVNAPVRLLRDGRDYRTLVFFGTVLASEWNDVPVEVNDENKCVLPGDQFWAPFKYIKTFTGLSP